MNEKIYRLLNQTVNDTDIEAEPLTDEEVKAMMKRFFNENNHEKGKTIPRKKHRFAAAMVAVAAAAVLVPTSVYAISRISAKIEQTAKYQNTVKIEAPTEAEGLSARDEEYMMFELGYIPEGFIFGDENSPYAGKYHNYETDGGITTTFTRLPADGKEYKINLSFSENCENYESDGKTAMINYRVGYSTGGDKNGNPFGREVWISFNDTRYVLVLYVTNDISQDELYKIIDNISLYPTDEKHFGESIWWKDPANYSSGNGKTEVNHNHIVDPDNVNFLKIGETGDHNSDTLNCSLTINSAEFTDSFDGINTNRSGNEADFSAYMDKNGNILPNTRTWYTVGDGVNTLDEDIMSYDMPYHILKMNVTITNNADEYREFSIFPQLVSFDSNSIPKYDEEDLNIPSGYEDMDIKFYDSLDRIRSKNNIIFSFGNEPFFSLKTDEAHNGENNWVNLAAGESTDIEVCLVCSENRLGNLYVSFYTTGNSFSESLKLGFPMFSLCDLRPE